MAVIAGHIDIVNLLLRKGADLEARDGDHMTPVHRYTLYMYYCETISSFPRDVSFIATDKKFTSENL